MEAVGVVLRYLHRLELFQAGFLGYLVLALVRVVFEVAYVGDVADVAHLVAQVLQVAEEEVEGDGRTGVAQVGITIDGGAADVHADASRRERLEEFLLPAQGVINKEWLFHC